MATIYDDGIKCECVADLAEGEEIDVETGYRNWDRSDDEFHCIMGGYDDRGRAILDAQNAICMDGRNKFQPYFLVDPRAPITPRAGDLGLKLLSCYVIWHVVGMDVEGRLILHSPHWGLELDLEEM